MIILGPYTYLIETILSTPQVWLTKQWNLVIINLNLLVGYGLYIYTTIKKKQKIYCKRLVQTKYFSYIYNVND